MFACRLTYGNMRREEISLATVPRVGEIVALGLEGPKFRIDGVEHIAHRREETGDPHLIHHATKVDDA